MDAPAITIKQLAKRYRIGIAEETHDTLVGAVKHTLSRPLANFKRLRNLAHFKEDEHAGVIWALKGVDLEVPKGEVLGVIGSNGAGKSTLLKIISRITTPTKGSIEIRGTVSSLLEVGTGFHGDLTGRENLYLNGAILGMTKKEIDKKFKDIVAFSGVDKFIDTPVKRYSSGMTVRLAFSVAAHLEPEILLVDEVLAVGDANFQQKCLGKMEDVASHGRTVMFVSHNMTAVQGLCPKTVWIKDGKIEKVGETREVIREYLDSSTNNLNVTRLDRPEGYAGLVVTGVSTINHEGKESNALHYGDDVEIKVTYRALKPVPEPYLWIDIQRRGGVFGANMFFDEMRPKVLEGEGTISCRFKNVKLLPGDYIIFLGVKENQGRTYIAGPGVVGHFTILGNAQAVGMPGKHADNYLSKFSPVVQEYEWIMPDGAVMRPDWCKRDYRPGPQKEATKTIAVREQDN